MPLELVTIPCLADNYAFLLHDAESGQTACIDVPEAAPILAALDARGWALTDILLTHQPQVRCCAVLPSAPDAALGYEYLPEEEVDEAEFQAIVAAIRDPALHEALDMAHLACASGVCPI